MGGSERRGDARAAERAEAGVFYHSNTDLIPGASVQALFEVDSSNLKSCKKQRSEQQNLLR